MILSAQTFLELPQKTRELIIKHTFEEENTGITQKHSIRSIVNCERSVAIGARMTSKPFVLQQYDSELTCLGVRKRYSGEEIANIFAESVRKYGKSYFPITGDWTRTPQDTLILFVKVNKRYEPYAKFTISEIIQSNELSLEQAKCLTDPTPVKNSTFRSILEITNVSMDFPEDISFIGLSSGEDIYDRAFKGGAPVIMIL